LDSRRLALERAARKGEAQGWAEQSRADSVQPYYPSKKQASWIHALPCVPGHFSPLPNHHRKRLHEVEIRSAQGELRMLWVAKMRELVVVVA
jgi:phage-related protein